jgi:hypothetical protein
MKSQSGQRGILMIAAAMITIGIIVMVPTARVFVIQRTSEWRGRLSNNSILAAHKSGAKVQMN